MQVHITGRQVVITPALRKFTEERLKKLDKLLGGTTEAHVVLAVEKRRYLAEIQVKSRTALLAGEFETGDLYASIGGVVLKLERQALKHKEKITTGKRRLGRRAAPVETPLDPRRREDYPAGVVDAALISKVKTLSVAERLELIGAVWESFSGNDVPVSEEEKALLDARLTDIETSPEDESAWSEVQARLRSRLP